MAKFKFYTDGNITLRLHIEDTAPEGFYRGRTFHSNPWNKGKTKEDDPRIRASSSSFKKGHPSWNSGLTRENCPTLQLVASKVSAKNKGKPAWNKGIPMKEDAREKLSRSHLGRPMPEGTAERGWETKHLNGTCKSSKPEEDMYIQLCKEYGPEDILRNYNKDPRYPFAVDFYIKSADMFIELNLHWTHGPHPFNPDDEEDLRIRSFWEEKAATKKFYGAAIETWTSRDVKKLNVARENHLNFKFIYKGITVVA